MPGGTVGDDAPTRTCDLTELAWDVIPRPLFWFDGAARIASANPAACAALGYAVGELDGRPLGSLADPATTAAVRALLSGQPLPSGGDVYARFTARTGVPRAFSLELHRVARPSASDAMVLAVATAHSGLEPLDSSHLRAGQERWLFQVLETLPVGVTIVDAKRRAHYHSNLLATEMLGEFALPGVPLGDFSRLCQAFVAGTQRPYPADELPIFRALEGESSQIYDLELERDGARTPVHMTASPVRDPEGGVVYAIAALLDMTARQDAEMARKESETRFRELFEAIGEAIFYSTPEGRIVTANPSAVSLFGYPVEELATMNGADLYAEPRMHQELMKALATRGLVRDFPAHIRRRDGTCAEVLVTANVRTDPDGNPVGVMGTIRDVTERRQLERELAQAQKLEAIGQLAAGVAHEINTPIQYVGDNIRFLQDAFGDLLEPLALLADGVGTADDGASSADDEVPASLRRTREALAAADLDFLREEVPDAISQSLEGIEHVAEIVRAMKEFSHPAQKEFEAADINQAIRSTLTVSRNEWKYVAEVETELDPHLPLVHCLPGELNQVFLNLVVNAAHAVGEARRGEGGGLGRIVLRTRSDGDEVVVEVEDNGTGIPDDVRGRIFEPFFTTKEVGRGTGQGLAIARSVVVDKHGGRIWVESRPGEGSTFYVRLPVHPPVAKSGPQHADESRLPSEAPPPGSP